MKTKTILLTLLMMVFCLNGWSMEQQAGRKLVYSISTDGFVSSKIIGVLATNRKGAVLLSSKGTWWKVRVDNVVGYVHSKYVTLSSKPVKISGLPTVQYVVISTCNSMAEVKQFFCASDVAVLPYRSATQSGISSIAYHFDVPMIVTDVGGLKGTIGERGTGIVASEPSPEAIRKEILRYFSDTALQAKCREAIGEEKQRLGWDAFCAALTDFAATL